MAIDTAAKRRMAACTKPIIKAPIPDGDITEKDRAHICWTYGALIVEAPAVAEAYGYVV